MTCGPRFHLLPLPRCWSRRVKRLHRDPYNYGFGLSVDLPNAQGIRQVEAGVGTRTENSVVAYSVRDRALVPPCCVRSAASRVLTARSSSTARRRLQSRYPCPLPPPPAPAPPHPRCPRRTRICAPAPACTPHLCTCRARPPTQVRGCLGGYKGTRMVQDPVLLT